MVTRVLRATHYHGRVIALKCEPFPLDAERAVSLLLQAWDVTSRTAAAKRGSQ